ncbi:5,10-methylenetetrahydrofolate reductase, partial [Vibrio parahaemolyticus V-223/04]
RTLSKPHALRRRITLKCQGG